MTSFRDFIPPPGDRRRDIASDAYSFADDMRSHPILGPVLAGWLALTEAPFRGITTNGRLVPDLYTVEDETAPVDAMVIAARTLTMAASAAEREKMMHPVNAHVWRMWMNPEVYVNRFGIRLDEVSQTVRDAVMAILRASLSPYGYQKAVDCMYVNGFLGEICNAPLILNAWSYNFNLFGTPSTTEPWGWQLFGHHLSINCMVIGRQMVMTPCFWGAEPNEVDVGPRRGLKMFQDEESRGLSLMQGLDDRVKARARFADGFHDPKLPDGRVHFGDNFHLAGAFQDNRVIPYEGVSVADFTAADRNRLLDIVEAYHRHLPEGPRMARMGEIERHLGDTHFCWAGGWEDDSPFYYRVQSPVTIIEFDHHCGIYLTNEEPQKFHIHTLMRTPNGNDYGMAVVRKHCEAHQCDHAQMLLK